MKRDIRPGLPGLISYQALNPHGLIPERSLKLFELTVESPATTPSDEQEQGGNSIPKGFTVLVLSWHT